MLGTEVHIPADSTEPDQAILAIAPESENRLAEILGRLRLDKSFRESRKLDGFLRRGGVVRVHG